MTTEAMKRGQERDTALAELKLARDEIASMRKLQKALVDHIDVNKKISAHMPMSGSDVLRAEKLTLPGCQVTSLYRGHRSRNPGKSNKMVGRNFLHSIQVYTLIH